MSVRLNARLMGNESLNPLFEVVDRFFRWFRGRFQAMFALAILSGLALFLSDSVFKRLQVSEPEWARGLALILFGFSSIYLFIGMVSWCLLLAKKIYTLHHLSDDQRSCLYTFIRWNTLTQGFISHSATAHQLETIGILESRIISNAEKNRVINGGGAYFSIKPWALSYLKKRPHLIRAEEFGGRPGTPPKRMPWPMLRDWLETHDATEVDEKNK